MPVSQEHPPPQSCSVISACLGYKSLSFGEVWEGQQDEDHPPARAERPTKGQGGPFQSSRALLPSVGWNSSSWLSHRCRSTQPFLSLLPHNSTSPKVWQTPSKAHDSTLRPWIRAALPPSPPGEASRVWKSQYQVCSPQITELMALNEKCAGEGEDMGCALQLCQYRLWRKSDIFNWVGSKQESSRNFTTKIIIACVLFR